MPILTHVGVLQGGVIAPAARQGYVDQTNLLLANGTSDFLFGALPPPLQVTGNPFFATSFNVKPIEKHEDTFPVWHQVFIDTMFEKTANVLDADGKTPIFPIFDITLGFPFDLRPNLTLPDFVAALALPPFTPPQLELLFDLKPPDLVELPIIALELPLKFAPLIIPPIPPIPTFALPSFNLPTVPGINVPIPPKFTFPLIPPVDFNIKLPLPALQFLLCAVVKAIPAIFAILIAKAIAGDLVKALGKGIAGLVIFVALVVIDAIAGCLGIELKNVLTFLAGFLVYIEKLVFMIAVVLVGLILGEGLLVKLIATLLGLV